LVRLTALPPATSGGDCFLLGLGLQVMQPTMRINHILVNVAKGIQQRDEDITLEKASSVLTLLQAKCHLGLALPLCGDLRLPKCEVARDDSTDDYPEEANY
jgi:hypothetical protein